MAFSHGLFLGKRQLTILTPSPLVLTPPLCLPSHLLTSLETCQLAVQDQKQDLLADLFELLATPLKGNRVVMELTGLPSTNLSHVCPSSSGT